MTPLKFNPRIPVNPAFVGISIIIPTYNAEKYLSRCIESVINQPLDDFELVIIDDGSVDRTCQVVEQAMLKDSRITLFRQTANYGAPAARNIGIRLARGKYLLFLDSDDYLVEESLSELFNKAEQLKSDAIKGCMLVDKGGKKLTPHTLNQKIDYTNTNLSNCEAIQHLYQYQSYLLKTSIVRTFGIEFDESLRNFQDPVFLASLLPVCPRIDVVLDPVYVRTVRPRSIVTSDWNLENYMSLARGVSQAYQNLISSNQIGAAELMAQSFSLWWYKMEALPTHLDENHCKEVFEAIRSFSRNSQHLIWESGWLKVGARHSLMLISDGRYHQCYKKLSRSLRLRKVFPSSAKKLIDILNFAFSQLLGKV